MAGLIDRFDPQYRRKKLAKKKVRSRPSRGWPGEIIEDTRLVYADTAPQQPMFHWSAQRQGPWYGKTPYEIANPGEFFLASKPVYAVQLYDVVKYVGSYQRFIPKRVSDKIRKADAKALIWVGREHSPVLYIKPSSQEAGSRLYKSLEKTADEAGFVGEMPSGQIGEPEYSPGKYLRLWWD